MKRWIRTFAVAMLLLAALVIVGCVSHSDGDRAVFGGSDTLQSGETLDGDLAVFGGSMTIEEGATVDGEVALFGGTLYLDGIVEGDLATFGGTVVRGERGIFVARPSSWAAPPTRTPRSPDRASLRPLQASQSAPSPPPSSAWRLPPLRIVSLA